MKTQITKFDFTKHEELRKYLLREKEINNDYDSRTEKYVRGFRCIFRFSNDFGASIIKRHGSYGFKDNLWELCVLHFDDKTMENDYALAYGTDITGDVEGHLSDDNVAEMCIFIQRLKKNGKLTKKDREAFDAFMVRIYE